MSSTTRTITIGELAIRVNSADLASVDFDTAIASDFEVEVEFTYKQARAEDDQIADLRVTRIESSANVHFSGTITDVIVRRRVDLLPLVVSRNVTEIEAMLMVMVEAGQ